MKNLFVILLVSLCAVASQAQEPENNFAGTTIFSGVVYDSDIGTQGKQLSGRYGVVQSLGEGSPLHLIPNVEFGKYNSLSTELALLFTNPTTPWTVGLLAGPNVDWVYPANDPITYLTGAAGGLVAYDLGDYGLWFAGKYKFSGVKDDSFNDGFVAGFGFYAQF